MNIFYIYSQLESVISSSRFTHSTGEHLNELVKSQSGYNHMMLKQGFLMIKRVSGDYDKASHKCSFLTRNVSCQKVFRYTSNTFSENELDCCKSFNLVQQGM